MKTLEGIARDLNGWLRNRRVPRGAAAVFAAMTKREAVMLTRVFDGRSNVMGADWVRKLPATRACIRNIEDDLALMNLPKASRDRMVAAIAHEYAMREELDEELIETLITESIRDALVENKLITTSQYEAGVEDSFPEPPPRRPQITVS